MRIALFYQSLLSDWNHGNAHFLRGIATELMDRGHELRIFEPRDSWSYQNLVLNHGDAFLERFRRVYPALGSTRYDLDLLDLEMALDGVDLVLVHEWNNPRLIGQIAEYRRRHANCRVLFHDTHHRSLTDSDCVLVRELENYDGILAFGESISERYRRLGWRTQVWTWHEAADVRVFHPLKTEAAYGGDLVWIGNWGDGERTREIAEFLINPVRSLSLKSTVHGVRYPEEALASLRDAGIDYRGWIPNFEVPRIFARFKTTVHIPRRPYAEALPGVPTIRMFESLACGVPLVSAPWLDSENLFDAGRDFLMAANGEQMKKHLRMLLSDPSAAAQLASRGLLTIWKRHTCGHRVDELLRIYKTIEPRTLKNDAVQPMPELVSANCQGGRI